MNALPKILLGSVLLLVLHAPARANLVPGLDDWSYTGNTLYSNVFELPPGVPDVAIFNAGNKAPVGTVSDSFATVAGDQYTVDFDYSTGIAPDATQQQLDYSAIGGGLLASGTVAGPLDELEGADFDSIPTFVPTTFSFDFKADSPVTTLSFADVDTNQTISEDGDLYDVDVAQTGAASVPDRASTVLLLGVALAGVASLRSLRCQANRATTTGLA